MATPRRVTLAPGVALHCTEGGLLARTTGRWMRVALHAPELEAELLRELGAGAIDVDERRRPCVRAMLEAGIVREAHPPPVLFDYVGIGAELRIECVEPTAWDGPSAAGAIAVLAGAPDDARMGATLEKVVGAARPCIVIWLDESGIGIARDDGAHRPCALCAWLQDSLLCRYLARGESVVGLPRACAGEGALVRTAAAMLELMLADPAMAPQAGQTWYFDRSNAMTSVAELCPHPSCRCATRATRARPLPALEPRPHEHARYAPIWPVAGPRDAAVARVIYRRSRTPWLASTQALGVALAAGPGAGVRARAEAIERFCMLHAPPDRRSARAAELDGDVLHASAIEASLFRSDQYAIDGFRFAPYDPAQPLDWSRAYGVGDARSRWIPTSLVGRVPRGGRALLDATSNGYACHHDRDEAVVRALLELIERDAILLHWYAPRGRLVRIEGASAPDPATTLFLATQDIDLPVVIAFARGRDDSIRAGSAAATDLDGAIEAALRELDASLTGVWTAGTPVRALDDARARHQPEDHLAFYASAAGRDVLERLAREAEPADTVSLRRRWPLGRPALDAILAALDACRLDAWVVERSLPEVFGADWHVVRAFAPDLVELSWGMPYRRLASSRLERRWREGAPSATDVPHPIV